MRPFGDWLTNTFQSPKVAMRLGLAASLLSGFLAAAPAGARAKTSPRVAMPAVPTRQKEKDAGKIIDVSPRARSSAAPLAEGSGQNSGLAFPPRDRPCKAASA